MMTAEEYKKDNEERVLLALGILLLTSTVSFPSEEKEEPGEQMTGETDIKKINTFEDLPKDIKEKAENFFKDNKLDKLTNIEEPLTKSDVLKIVSEVAEKELETKYFKIISVGDDHVCEYCKMWEGKIVTMTGEDPRYPTLDEFLNSDGAHFGCRCYLQPYTPKKPTTKELKDMAMNADSLKDTLVYRGFVDKDMDPDLEYDYDDKTLVMITPLGTYIGSSPDGTPTKEIIDEESILKMAQQTEEILLDKDHASMRPIEDRNTEAMGWISGLKAITGLGSLDGLYGVIKWAGEGMRLAKERVYRFLSPVFELDEDGRAVKLVNVALTNRPALKMPPIINSEADKNEISITNSQKDIHMDMNKDELVDLIKATVTAMNSCSDMKEEVKNEEEKTEEVKEETPVENACGEDKKEEVKNEESEEKKDETPDEDKKDEVKEEDKKEEDKKEEVIKIEALNTAPLLGNDAKSCDKWRSLKGKEFFEYLKKHPEIKG